MWRVLIINLRARDVDFPTDIFRGCVPVAAPRTGTMCYIFSMNERRNWSDGSGGTLVLYLAVLTQFQPETREKAKYL